MEKRTKELETHQRQLYKKMLGATGTETTADKREVWRMSIGFWCFDYPTS